jgi:hypothetical protein
MKLRDRNMRAQPRQETLSFYVDTLARFFVNRFTPKTKTARTGCFAKAAVVPGWMPAHPKKT